MKWYHVLITACFIVAVGLVIFSSSKENSVETESNLLQMKQANQLVKDSLERIIAESQRRDQLYKVKIDSLSSQLEMIRGLAFRLNPRLHAMNEKIKLSSISWDELTKSQKDSVILSAIKLSR